MELAIVSDEISLDFREAVDHGLEWGVENYEICNLKSGRVPYVNADEIDSILDVIDAYEVKVSAISPGLFKISMRDEEQLKQQLEEKIYDSFRFAEKVGTRDVIIHSFKRYADEPASDYMQIVHILGRMATLAEKYGFRLLLENEIGYWCDTGDNTSRVLEDINSRALRANWDPGNAFAAGEIPYPYGYLAVRKFISNIHIKDARQSPSRDVEWVSVGLGEIDWMGQLQAIRNGLDVRYLTVETQCQPLLECSRRNVDRIHNLMYEYLMNDNYMIR
ncbi:sugar phosphate isomerase/epimerase [candidate division KSB1 bacterium]|nr:sugar phosphate isomerase/epimerase [candidate division KSB1 bacterium]